MSGTWVLKSETIRQSFLKYINSLPITGQVITISKRLHTTPQQRYFHMLCGILDESLGHKEGYHKMKFKFAVLPLETVEVNGVAFLYPVSSTKADRGQYMEMINLALIEGDKAGIILPDASTLGLDS